MATDLTGLQVRNTYNSLLKIGDNSNLTGTAKRISDGLGNDSPLFISTSQISIGVAPATGYDLTVNSGIRTGFIDVLGAATAQSLQFTGGSGTQATMSWNTDEETVDLIQNGTTLQLGQEIHVHVKNQTGSTILDGTPVYVTGTLGASGRLTVAPMIADNSIPAKYFLGVTTEDIPNGQDGKVTTFGKIRGLNTSAYSDGQTLFVSASTAGAFQTTAPVAPNLDLEVAIVINSHANNGTIFVRANQGLYLGMLHDVYVNSPANNQLLVYNSSNTRWENQAISSISSINLDSVTDNGNTTDNDITVGDINAGNVTLTGYLRGAANFVIDPAAYGDETGVVQILGDLRVDGTTTTINSTTVTIDDKNIVLASGSATAADANGAGITIDGANASMTYVSATDRFVFNKDIDSPNFDLQGITDEGASTTNIITASGGINGLTLANGISGTNFNITGVNQLEIADPGEGIVWKSGSSGDIYLAVVDDASDNRLNLSGTGASLSINNELVATQSWVNTNTLNQSEGDARYVNVTGDTMTGDLDFNDNVKAKFGTGDDLTVYHNATNSFIDNATGSILIRNQADDQDIVLVSDDGAGSITDYLRADGSEGSVKLFYYGSQKLETTATGVSVTGALSGNISTSSITGGTIDINGTTAINLQYNGTTQLRVDSSGVDYLGTVTFANDGISLTDDDSTIDSFFHANVDYDAGIYTVTSNARYGADYIQVDGLDSRSNTVFAISPKDSTTTNPDLFIGGDNAITSPNTLTDWRNIKMNATSVQINGNEVATQSWVTSNTLNETSGDNRYLQLSGGDMTGNITFGQGDKIVFPDNTSVPNSPTNEQVDYITFGSQGSISQVSGRGALMITSSDDSLILANGDVGRSFTNNELTVAGETTYLLSDGAIEMYSDLQDGWDGSPTPWYRLRYIGGSLTTWNGSGSPDTYWSSADDADFNSLKIGGTTVVDSSLNIYVPDSQELRLGTGNDLRLYHTSTNSYVDNYTGSLLIRNFANDQDIILATDDDAGGNAAYIICDGSTGDVKLYYADAGSSSLKFQTKADGVEATGNIEAIVDSNGVIRAVHDGNNISQLQANTSGGVLSLLAQGTNNVLLRSYGDSFFVNNVAIGKTSASEKLDVDGNAAITGNLKLDGVIYHDTDTSGAISSGTWYRIIEITGGSGRGKCDFTLDSGGGSGTPFTLKATVNTNWANAGSTLVCHFNSYGSNVRDLRVVRNATSNKSFVDVRFSGGEDNVVVRIQPTVNAAADTVNFTNVTTLPTGDSVETTLDVNGNVFSTTSSQASGNFVVSYDSQVGIKQNSPSYDLDVLGNARIDDDTPYGGLLITGNNAPALTLIDGSSTAENLIYAQSTADVQGVLRLSADDNNVGTDSSMEFRVDGTECMRIDTGGNVGIGKTSPAQKLDVEGSIRFNDELQIYTGTTDIGQISNLSGALNIQGTSTRDVSFGSDTKPQSVFLEGTNGYLGIGTTTPNRQLEVKNSGDAWFRLDGAGAYFDFLMDGNLRMFNANGEAMRISANGNVGIGETNPLDLLHISSSTTDARMVLDGASGYDAELKFFENGSVKYTIGHDADSGNFVVGTTNVDTQQRLVIDSSGKVGIGNTSPTRKLHVTGAAQIDNGGLILGGTSSVNGNNPQLRRVNSSNDLSIATNGSDRIRIKGSDGNVGIGTTSPSYDLDVTGTIRATADIIAYSDARVKENVKTIDNALDKVTKLRGVEYNKIGETEQKIGVIAQEIEQILPQVVQEDTEGMKSVAYGNIVGVLIESIKELKQEIDELKARLDGSTN